jgi:hypothetical protein
MRSKSGIVEEIPLVRSAKVTHRTCSRPLQSALADFAADQAFAQTVSSCRSTMAS